MWNHKRIHERWQKVAFRLNAHLRLGQDEGLYASNLNSIYKGWHEGILLRDWTSWLGTNVCINLENLQQKVEKKQQSVEKDHTHNKITSQIESFCWQS